MKSNLANRVKCVYYCKSFVFLIHMNKKNYYSFTKRLLLFVGSLYKFCYS